VTREAIRTGFERFVDDAISHTQREFDVARALRQGVRGPGKRLVGKLLNDSETLRRRVVEPELDSYRNRILQQFDVLLDAIESDGGVEAYREELLATDSYAQALRSDLGSDRRETIHDALVARQRRLASAVAPVVASPAEQFWPAVEDVFDREQAQELVTDHFAFTGPLQDHRRAYEMKTAFEPGDILGGLGGLLGGSRTVEVEYTNEAVRSLRRAERQVIADTTETIEQRF
jgi:hypothetical protein